MAIKNPTKYVTVRRLERFRQKLQDGFYPVIAVSGATPAQTLKPNCHYVFGTCTSLTLTFGTAVSNIVNEYSFEFDSGTTATTLTVPNGIIWQVSPSISANKHYEVNIKYNATTDKYYGLIVEF